MQSHFAGEIKVPWYISRGKQRKKACFKDLFKVYQNKRAMNNNKQEFQKSIEVTQRECTYVLSEGAKTINTQCYFTRGTEIDL